MTAKRRAPREADFLAGGGEMGVLMRSTDWSRTALGRPEDWPQSLRTAVGIMLSSRYAMFVWWGRELVNLYNDSYRPFLGKKHPQALGRSARDVWSEIWHLIGPRTEAVLERAEATFDEALLLIMERFGYPEETYFTFSYSPIRTVGDEVGGLFCAVTDETARVIGERRLKLLREVAAKSPEAHAPEQVCTAAAACIGGNARDLPFALLYVTEPGGKTARLVAQTGIEAGMPGAAPSIVLDNPEAAWPLAAAAESNAPVIVDGLGSRFAALPTGAWDRPPSKAVVVPLAEQGQSGAAGFLVAGLNPYLAFEEEYRGFLGLLAGQIAAGIANACAYQEERRRADALAEIDRAKTAFFSNVSHEFRTPLTLMLGSLEELLAQPGDTVAAAAQQLGGVAHRSALRLLKLVNTLLDFSRIEAGRVQASYEPTDLGRLTADLASNFRAACERAGLALTVTCNGLDGPVYIDRDMWEKIVLNLVSNAFKYTHSGGITVGLSRRGDSAEFSVSDTGIGIPHRELPHLFERFHRVEGAQGRTHEGSGIGLALVHDLVKLHGGAVRADSVEGEGSIFTVTIPLGDAHLPAERIKVSRPLASTAVSARSYVEEALRWLPSDGTDAAAEPAVHEGLVETSSSLGPEPGPAGERPAILIADDNADMRDYLRRLLERRYQVTAAADGEAALALMRKLRFDLVLSDVMMPRLDGFGLLRTIRADPAMAELPLVLLSARAGDEASIEGLEAGASDYLVKPFSGRELQARVAAALEMARLRRRRRQAEEEADRTRSQLQAIVDDAPIGIYFLDSDLRIRHANPGARPVFGDAYDPIGRDFREYMHRLWPPETAEDVIGRFQHTLCTGEPYRAREFSEERRDLNRREYYDWQIHRITLPDGQRGVVCYFLDIGGHVLAREAFRELSETLEKRVEERSRELEAEMAERRKAETALHQAQRLEAVGKLTGGIAHDFNNLLTVILAQAESISIAAKGAEPITRMATSVQRVVARGAELTSQLLSFSRLQTLRPEPVLLGEFLAKHSEFIRRAIGEAITAEFDADGQLWPSMVDPGQFEAAILNLAVNSRDAMPGGGRFRIAMRNIGILEPEALDIEPGDYVVVTVSDSGDGMPPEVQSRCFEPFFTTKEVGKGTGLGLSQVYGFTRQSGGTATVESAPGAGTTIALYLPRAVAAPYSQAETRLEPPATPEPGKTILLVEDQPDVRDILESSLQRAGYAVVTAQDGVEARERIARDRSIDLLLTDIVMPNGVSGIELAQWAKQIRTDLKIVLMSGYAGQQGNGVDDKFTLLRKPFRHAELLRTISDALCQDVPEIPVRGDEEAVGREGALPVGSAAI